MGRLRPFTDTFNRMTGIRARHNRALRDVKDWAATLQKFLSSYDLYGSPTFKSLFTNIGEAKFDLTAISYNARPLVKEAKNIREKQVPQLVAELAESLEGLRRALINPSLHIKELGEIVPGLLIIFEKLQDVLSDVKYM